jgi:hypothetical protein
MMVLYLLPEPAIVDVREGCASEQASEYVRYIVSLGGYIGAELEDQSFLLSGPAPDNLGAIVVRLSKDLTIPKVCNAPSIVVVDMKDLPEGFGLENRNSRELQNAMKAFFLERRSKHCHQ